MNPQEKAFPVFKEKVIDYNEFLFGGLSQKFQKFMNFFFFFERGTAERKEGETGKEKKYDQLSITFTTTINKNIFLFFILIYNQTAFCNSLKL